MSFGPFALARTIASAELLSFLAMAGIGLALTPAAHAAPPAARLSLDLHGGGRFLGNAQEDFFGRPVSFGAALGAWHGIGPRFFVGASLGIDGFRASKKLAPVRLSRSSELSAVGVDVPFHLHGGWSPLGWMRLALGAGFAWRSEQVRIDNPRGVGDDAFTEKWTGFALRGALEFPARVSALSFGTFEMSPSIALRYFSGEAKKTHRLRYDAKDLRIGGPETELALGLVVSLGATQRALAPDAPSTPSSDPAAAPASSATGAPAPAPVPAPAPDAETNSAPTP